MKYKKLDMKKVNGVEDDPECGQMDEEGNMITGFNLKVYYVILTHNSKKSRTKWKTESSIQRVNFTSRKQNVKIEMSGWTH